MNTPYENTQPPLDATATSGTPRWPEDESTDLLALRLANARLQEQLELRDVALDGIPTTFVIADRTTIEPTIIYCNKAAAGMFGMRPDEVIGRGVSEISLHNGTNKPDFQKDHATLSAGRSISHESEAQRKDGSTFWRGVTVMPLFDSSGALIRSIAMGADITAKREAARRQNELQEQLVAELKERERMLAELQLAQKLESVGRLASGIAHEMNTPIQYIGDCIHFLRSGYADTRQILDGLQQALTSLPADSQCGELRALFDRLSVKYELDFLDAETPKAFERISEGITRVSTIVGAMKEFAHPDSSEKRAADINRGIQSTLIVATHVYKFIARIHTDFSELPEVTCNIGELNQVFLNLIVNAAHAIEDSAQNIDTGVIKISTARDGDKVIVRIGDNGCGIPPEHLSKLYDPFYTTKEVGRGTGQGLAIARSIVVDKHGGDLSVSSNIGVGTEFTVTLPIGEQGVSHT
jgi:two-component system NtrC family sensor kinase